MAFNQTWTEYDDAGYPVRAASNAAIAAAAGTTVVKNAPGRAVAALVTTAGTSTDNAIVYDGPAASGVILAVILGGTTVGTRIIIDAAAKTNITVVNVGSGPAFTLNYA